MCTLIVISRMFKKAPLVVAANRDENLDRPSGPPRQWTDRPLAVFAPVDLKAGGTWLGISQAGVFAGVTNRFGAEPPHADRRSRGMLVLDALEEPDARSAFGRLAEKPAQMHNRFHLLLADRDSAFLIFSDGQDRWTRELEPGVHVLTERSLGAASSSRESWIADQLARLPEQDSPDVSSLRRILSFHGDDPFDGTCVHAPLFNYGTRSSTIIIMGTGNRDLLYLHAEGPPCDTDYEDLSAQAAAII